MDTPRSFDVAAPPPNGHSGAPQQIDGVTLAAMLAILIGWFFADTLVVSMGSLQHGVRFFDISSAIANPMKIFFRVDSAFQRVMFGATCLVCLLAPLLPHRRRSRWAWAAYLAPLTLMLISAALLYSRTSGEFLASSADPNSLGGNVIRFANNLVHQGGGLISRHISIGPGGYLAFAGSVVLALRGTRHFRRHAA
jgi:hypothetical protein